MDNANNLLEKNDRSEQLEKFPRMPWGTGQVRATSWHGNSKLVFSRQDPHLILKAACGQGNQTSILRHPIWWQRRINFNLFFDHFTIIQIKKAAISGPGLCAESPSSPPYYGILLWFLDFLLPPLLRGDKNITRLSNLYLCTICSNSLSGPGKDSRKALCNQI